MRPSREISRLVEIMAALRDPETGCPWDIEQNFSSISPYTIEEAYEVADAIERQDWDDLKDELGDLLLQPVYHARMAEERGLFNFADVIEAITKKMIRRHPHVFGDEKMRSLAMAKGAWEKIKAREKLAVEKRKLAAGITTKKSTSLLDDIPSTLPSLQSAVKLQKKAASVGFDWHGPEPVLEKLSEEMGEVTQAISENNKSDIEMEIGDLLFTIANLARHLDIEPDNALRISNRKFRDRFAKVETELATQSGGIKGATADQMEVAWENAKQSER